nr:hypothetical protein [Tanacetum cinerariifolium]
MSSITAQQAKLDLELVSNEKRLDIRKFNERLILERYKENPHFKSFLRLLLSLYATLHLSSPQIFKMDKRKRFKLTLEIFKDIIKIFPKVQGQDFDALPTDKEIVSFQRELGHTGEINSLNDFVVDHMHQPWRTFAALINKSLSRKTAGAKETDQFLASLPGSFALSYSSARMCVFHSESYREASDYWNGAHVGYNCPSQVPSFQTLPSFPQQYPCYEDYGVLPEADHCQPPQYTVNHPIVNVHNDLLNAQNKLMEQMTQLTSIMGDEHLDTISAIESDKFIKFCVENLVPNPKFVSDNNDADIESFSPSPIPIEDSDSIMEEIGLSFTLDDPMPLGIEEDDDDSERDILILEELLYNYSLSFPENESYHFDIPLFSRPPAKPPDGNTGILNIKMMGDNSE